MSKISTFFIILPQIRQTVGALWLFQEKRFLFDLPPTLWSLFMCLSRNQPQPIMIWLLWQYISVFFFPSAKKVPLPHHHFSCSKRPIHFNYASGFIRSLNQELLIGIEMPWKSSRAQIFERSILSGLVSLNIRTSASAAACDNAIWHFHGDPHPVRDQISSSFLLFEEKKGG